MSARSPRWRAPLVLAWLLAWAAPAGGQSRLGALLARGRASGPESAEQQRVREELERLGPAAVPEILALLAGQGDALLAPDPSERELLEECLRDWPAQAVLAALLQAARADAPLGVRMLAVQLAGSVRAARALGTLDELCARFSPEERCHPLVQQAFETALVEVFQADASALTAAEELARKRRAHEALLLPLAAALGRVGTGQGIATLRHLLGRNVELDQAVLEALGRLGQRAGVHAVDVATSLLHGRLYSADPRIRRQAVVSLGRVRAGAVAGELIGLLDDPDRRVQRAAVWALEQISGLAIGSERGEWELWHDRELAWYEEALPALDEALQRAEAAPAVAELQGLALHPLFRRELAAAAVQALQHAESVVVLAACATLVKLGTASALVGLVEALEDPREAVRAAAHDALERLTGAEVSASAEAWRAWLEAA